MMHNRPSDPEYCQGIYDAAKRLTDEYVPEKVEEMGYVKWIERVHYMIKDLKRALEGKP